MNFIKTIPVSKILPHTRYFLTLCSREDPTVHLSRNNIRTLILFHLSTNNDASSISEQLYLVESGCPHRRADKSYGDTEESENGFVVICPWHSYDFDLRTGHSDTSLKDCVYKFDIRKGSDDDEDMLWVELPEEGKKWKVLEFMPMDEGFTNPLKRGLPGQTPPRPVTLREDIVPNENPPKTLIEWAVLILNTPHPQLKIERTRHAVQLFRSGKLESIGRGSNAPKPPDVPLREDTMKFVEPREAGKGQVEPTTLHDLASIEHWAIDLAWDTIARFGPTSPSLPHQFFSDFANIALDEARHFSLLLSRLAESDIAYGSLPIHMTLWSSAMATSHSLRARLAIVHLVLEAHGLDFKSRSRTECSLDLSSMFILINANYDEITHVTTGHRWFTFLCAEQGVDPVETFREEVRLHFSGHDKASPNEEGREKAGSTRDFYEDPAGALMQQPVIEVPGVKTSQ